MTLDDILYEKHHVYIGDAMYFLRDGDNAIMCETSNGMIMDMSFMANEEVCYFNGHWIFKD